MFQNEPLFQQFGQPASKAELTAAIEDVVKFSVKTGHPLFLNQLYSGMDPYGLAGAWLTEALNTNQSVSLTSTPSFYHY